MRPNAVNTDRSTTGRERTQVRTLMPSKLQSINPSRHAKSDPKNVESWARGFVPSPIVVDVSRTISHLMTGEVWGVITSGTEHGAVDG